MCGIAGLFRSSLPPEDRLPLVQRMLAFIQHRGPDEMAVYRDDWIVLGSARLSILDLDNGQQPMSDQTGRFWITYNGEVYNYKELRKELQSAGMTFRTTSDTEVVIQAWSHWGSAALGRFNGCFAFAVYDKRDRELFLVRDRFGKRPLFYTFRGQEVVFGSEMKTLLAHPRVQFAFDEGQLASIFANWAPLSHQTGFRDVCQVPLGSFLRLTSTTASLTRYAELPLQAEPFQGSLAEAASRTRAAISESVRLRLRSDVEVGAYLSGGLDSAIVTRLAVEHGGQGIRTFSIAFEDPEFDESAEQQEVQQELGVRHHALRISNADLACSFPAALWHAEVPVFRTAFIPMYLLSREVHRQGIKVVLTGEGADEAFLGYDTFKEVLIRSRWQEYADDTQRGAAIARLYPYLAGFRADKVKSLMALYQQLAGPPDDDLFAFTLRHNMSALTQRILRERSKDPTAALRTLISGQRDSYSGLDVVGKAQWLEYQTLLAGYLLSTQGDRMALGHGVENRCPFLDPNVVAWAAAVPLPWKLSENGTEKFLLRQAFAADLPASVLQRVKRPYRAPDLISALQHPPDYMEAVLSPYELSRVDILDVSFCQRFIEKIRRTDPGAVSPRESHTFMFILSLALLHRQFVRRQHQSVLAPETSCRVLTGRTSC